MNAYDDDGVIFRLADPGDGVVLRRNAGAPVPIGEPVHIGVVKDRTRWRKRRRTRVYINGWRQRRPAWLWTRINRVRERRFNRNAIG